MSEELTLLIKISADIEKAASALEKTAEATGKIGTTSDEASTKVDNLKKKIDSTTPSTMELVKGFSAVTTSAWALYQGYDKLIDTQVSVDRAMVAAKSSANSAEDAQKRYTATVAKFGPASEEATASLKDLEIAQERASVAQERADMVSSNLSEAYMGFAIGVVPATITMITGLDKVMKDLGSSTTISSAIASTAGTVWAVLTGKMTLATLATNVMAVAQGALNAIMSINPIFLVIAALAALAIAFKWAYDNVEPFRNAVDGLARFLGAVFKPVIDMIVGALQWLGGVWDWLTGKTAKAQAEQTKIIEEETQKQIDVIEANYAQLEREEADSYKKQVDTAVKGWSEKLNATLTGFDKVVDEYNKHYDELEKEISRALDDQLKSIEGSYRDQTDAIKDEYDAQLRATEQFYDDAMGVINAGLDAIKNARNADLDNLELNYLLQKKVTEEAYEAGKIGKNEYETKIKEIEDKYRDARSAASDAYRLQELQYEKDHAGELETLEKEKADELSRIKEEENQEDGGTCSKTER